MVAQNTQDPYKNRQQQKQQRREKYNTSYNEVPERTN